MRAEVRAFYGLTQPLSQAGYYETDHHRQILKNVRGAILAGRIVALCGVIGSGKTVTLRRLQQQLKEENKIAVSRSLAVDKHSIKLGTLIACAVLRPVTEQEGPGSHPNRRPRTGATGVSEEEQTAGRLVH